MEIAAGQLLLVEANERPFLDGLVEKFRGQGIATEITKSLLEWTLEQPEVSEVRAETDEDHLASRRVLEKTGFTFVGSDGETRSYAKRREPAVPDAVS